MRWRVKVFFREVIAVQGKCAVGSGSGFMGDLGLRQLLDGAQLVLNYGPVFFRGLLYVDADSFPTLYCSLSTLNEED